MKVIETLRILNLEDSETDAEIIRRHLEGAGYDLVFERVDTPEAMKGALMAGEWDIILTDYSMPQFTAIEALAILKEMRKDIPVIVISGTIGEEVAVEAMRLGAADYLMKGKLTRLGAAIEREYHDARSRALRGRAEDEGIRLAEENEWQRDRLNAIVASVPGLVWEAWGRPDAATQKINFASEYVETMLGYTVEEWLSTPNFWLSIVHPDDKERCQRESYANFASNKKSTQAFRWIGKDGRVVWVESTYVVLADESGQPAGLRGVAMDVTERRQAENAMQQTEERFRRYFELGLIGMAITSADKGILEANDELCKILGYDRGELLQKSWTELTHPDDLSTDVKLFEEVLAGKIEGYRLEKRFIHRKGDIINATIAVKCARNSDGSVAYLVALVQDTTERDRLDAAHREAEERYRQLFEGNPDPVFVFDQTTLRFLAVNDAAIREYGYSREELLSMAAADIWSPDDVAEFLQRLSEMPDGQRSITTRKHRRKDGGLIDVEIARRPQLFSGSQAWVMHARNVTAQRFMEGQLRQVQKMEAVGQLAGGIAHDFNNLLTVINGYSDLALTQLNASDPLYPDIEQIRRAGERAAAMTRQLLAFSRKQVLLPTIIDFNALIAELETILQRLVGEDIVLRTHLSPDLGMIKADRGQIEQVVMNLVINARDAMPTGGKLSIDTQNVELNEDYAAAHGGVKSASYVMLAISDTGVGMDSKTQVQIFDPFFTTKGVGKGTGLGLSTVHGIVQQSGGSIWVYSELGHGTTFKIYMPRVSDPTQRHDYGASPRAMGGHETVLLTEDDDMVRGLACRVLLTDGYTVLEAANGDAALLICEQHGQIDMLITDIVMPGMNGRELSDRVSRLRPGIKVLYMSGYTDRAVVHQYILAEDTPFIQKPFAPQALLKKVRDVLDTR